MKGNITPRQRALIEALMLDPDTATAARRARVSRTTAYRWMTQDATFQEALRAATDHSINGLSIALVSLSGIAVQTLRDVLEDPLLPAGTRVRAADIVVTNLLRLRETVTFAERLSKLEQEIGEGHDRQ